MSNILDTLNSLADQVPGLNQKALSQVQAARDIQLQQQVAAVPTGPGNVRATAQQLATQRAYQAGQDVVAQRQTAAAQAGQIADATIAEKARQGQMGLEAKKMAAAKMQQDAEIRQLQELRSEELESRKTVLEEDLAAAASMERLGIDQANDLQIATLQQREDLNRIGLNLKGKLIDSRIRFERDDRGRKFTNDRQAADWAAATAASRQDFNEKMSYMEHQWNLKEQAMGQAHAQIVAALERGYLKEQNDLDHKAKVMLANMKNELEKKIRKDKAQAKNKSSMFRTGGMIVGAVVGGVITYFTAGTGAAAIPAGAALGANVGGALGTVAAGQEG